MRKLNLIVACAAALALALVLAGCGGNQASSSSSASASASSASQQGQATVLVNADDMDDVYVDYGSSEIYTQEDIDAAIDVIMAEFDQWTGATMKRIVLADDATCTEDLAYCNSLREEGAPGFTQAIVFATDFHSPSAEQAQGTAWNPDTDYDDYTWHLARTDGGDWQLLTWGYA